MNIKTPLVLVAAAVMTACASTPGPRPVAAPAEPPPSLTKVYFYPQQGQSEAQQDRDRYECYAWAVRQTGFDPSRRIAPREERATVVPARSPLATIGAVAAIGALVGAAASDPGDGAKGAVVGAMAGTVLGSAVAAGEANEAARVVPERGRSRVSGRYQQDAAEYRRAMSACLEGRGYSVK